MRGTQRTCVGGTLGDRAARGSGSQDSSATVSPRRRVPTTRPSRAFGPCAPSPAVADATVDHRIDCPGRPASCARAASLRITCNASAACRHAPPPTTNTVSHRALLDQAARLLAPYSGHIRACALGAGRGSVGGLALHEQRPLNIRVRPRAIIAPPVSPIGLGALRLCIGHRTLHDTPSSLQAAPTRLPPSPPGSP